MCIPCMEILTDEGSRSFPRDSTRRSCINAADCLGYIATTGGSACNECGVPWIRVFAAGKSCPAYVGCHANSQNIDDVAKAWCRCGACQHIGVFRSFMMQYECRGGKELHTKWLQCTEYLPLFAPLMTYRNNEALACSGFWGRRKRGHRLPTMICIHSNHAHLPK